jgi:predicted O-methyltransferase YrrM
MNQLKRLALIFVRFNTGMKYLKYPLGNLFSWLFRSKETHNFTYNLTPMNLDYLASFIANITGVSTTNIAAYIKEINEDEALKAFVRKQTLESKELYKSDADIKFAKRIGWYAFVRATKPKIVVETGVDKGLGSCVLSAALLLNTKEGHPGKYYGTDIDPAAGSIYKGDYAQYGEILYGDSIESINKMTQPIDLFINDSDHSADYEYQEYLAITNKMSPNGIILGDNAHYTDKPTVPIFSRSSRKPLVQRCRNRSSILQ